jgi:hypothetical protein
MLFCCAAGPSASRFKFWTGADPSAEKHSEGGESGMESRRFSTLLTWIFIAVIAGQRNADIKGIDSTDNDI